MEEIKVQIKQNKIYAPLKLQWLKCTPEEKVRQEFICRLVNDYGYSLAQMEQELNLTERSKRGTGAARADIIVWANVEDKGKRKRALFVVECKAPSISIDKDDVYFQGFNYASWMHTRFFVVTNQNKTRFFKLKEGIVPLFVPDLEEIDNIPNAQQALGYIDRTFSLSVPIGLLPRDTEADNLYNCVITNHFFNLVGVGGSGKTSLAYLMMQKHESNFNEKAYVVVNNNIKDDFVEQINKTLRFEFDKGDDSFSVIIEYLRDNFKSELPNLLVLDINETSDNEKNDEIISSLLKNKDILSGWKILILSRENVDTRNRIDAQNLNDKEDVDFLKQLFLSKAGTRYNDFGNVAELFKTIFYNPLLTEQLGLYLNTEPELATIDDIKKILFGESFREEDIQGLSSDRHDEPIVSFLINLIKFNDLNNNEKNLLRHFVLWQTEYIGYDVLKDLLKGVFESEEDLKNALKSLYKRSILTTNNDKTLRYKLHGLLAESLREQIVFTKQDYSAYLSNIGKIIKYDYNDFIPYIDCIGNSLCKYSISHQVRLLLEVANKYLKIQESLYAKNIYEECICILKKDTYTTDCKCLLAKVYENFATLQQSQLNEFDAALANYTNAKCLYETIESSDAKYQNLARIYNSLAILYAEHLTDYQKAETYYITALTIRNKIIDNNPTMLHSKIYLYNNLALLQVDHLQKIQSANDNYNKAIELSKKIPSNNKECQKTIAKLYYDYATFQYLHLHNFALARHYYNKAIILFEQPPIESPVTYNELAKTYNNLANLEREYYRDYKSAKEKCKKAIKIAQQITESQSKAYTVFLVNYKHSLAEIYFDNKEFDLAKSILEEIQPLAEYCFNENSESTLAKAICSNINILLKKTLLALNRVL